MRRGALAVALACLLSGAASAHDFWIEPSAWRPAAAERIGVSLCIGERFRGIPAARNAARIEEFFAASAVARVPVVGWDGGDPAGTVRIESRGGAVLAYRSNRAFVEMPGERFDDYLREKGLDRPLAARSRLRSRARSVREAYSRHAKSLIGGADDRLLGFRLELVAEAPADPRAFRLYFQGRPLAGALVVATRRPAAPAAISARTDAEGRVRLALVGRGAWLVTAVHMTAAPAGTDAEWESFWASLTFQGEPAPAAAARCDEPPAVLAMRP